MLAQMGKECALLAESRHSCQSFEAEVAPLELALAEVSPLRKGDRLALMREHRQRIAMHQILQQNIGSGLIKVIRLIQIQVVGEDLKHVRAAFSDIVRQEFNSVTAHHRQQGVMSPLKVGPAEARLDRGKFTLQYRDKEIPTSASRFQKPRVNALRFPLDEVKHLLNQPPGRENLSVVCNALLGLDQIHRWWLAISIGSLWQ